MNADQLVVPITVDNFVRAATHLEFDKYLSLAGGVNLFFHFQKSTPVDKQPTIRMNRDTLYSVAVIDISEGATLTLPDVGARQGHIRVVFCRLWASTACRFPPLTLLFSASLI
jgi:hypothetical protein